MMSMNCGKMNVNDYGRIIDSDQISVLLTSIEKLKETENYYSNNWFYYQSSPKNNIENYIQETFSIYFPEIERDKVCGFEWWVHDEETIETVPLHFDCDEFKRLGEGEIVTPITSTITYLCDNLSPTIITDIETIGGLEYQPKYPSQIVYSFPGEGKFFTFDPKYLHGVAKSQSKRLTLLYNVWEYRPEDLSEFEMEEEIFQFEIYKNNSSRIELYSGKFNYVPLNIFGNEFHTVFPKQYINYETHLLEN